MFTAFGFKNRTKKRIFSKAMGRVPKKSCQQPAAERGKFKGHLHVTNALWNLWDRLRKLASWGHLFHDESKNVGGQPLGTVLHHTLSVVLQATGCWPPEGERSEKTVTALSLAGRFWALQQFYFWKQPRERKRLCPPGLSFAP